jgi:hypothetical protein
MDTDDEKVEADVRMNTYEGAMRVSPHTTDKPIPDNTLVTRHS